ncbi:hypothetical protein DFJ77DRAFT_508355 [Powellomyces hirtus]|nr:hypothetical protein DFJ77DRAFT_508355 [Powellomyces hirtus]
MTFTKTETKLAKTAAPAVAKTVPQLLLTVVAEGMHKDMCFRLARNQPLSRMMTTYANRIGCSVDALRFLYEGQHISLTNTPDQLGMLDGTDTVNVYIAQIGGGKRRDI